MAVHGANAALSHPVSAAAELKLIILTLQVRQTPVSDASDTTADAAQPPSRLGHSGSAAALDSAAATPTSSSGEGPAARRKTPKRLAAEALLASRHAAARSARPAWGMSQAASLDGGTDSVLSSCCRQTASDVQRCGSTVSDLDSCTSSQAVAQLSRFAMAAADAAAAAAALAAQSTAVNYPATAAAASSDQQAVHVAACDTDAPCCHLAAEQPAGAAAHFSDSKLAAAEHSVAAQQLPMQRANVPHWCSFPVAVPHIDWVVLMAALGRETPELRPPAFGGSADLAACSTMALGPIQV